MTASEVATRPTTTPTQSRIMRTQNLVDDGFSQQARYQGVQRAIDFLTERRLPHCERRSVAIPR